MRISEKRRSEMGILNFWMWFVHRWIFLVFDLDRGRGPGKSDRLVCHCGKGYCLLGDIDDDGDVPFFWWERVWAMAWHGMAWPGLVG